MPAHVTQWFVYRRFPDNSGAVVSVHDTATAASNVARALVALGPATSMITYEVWRRDLVETFRGPEAPPTDPTRLRGDDSFGPVVDTVPRERLS